MMTEKNNDNGVSEERVIRMVDDSDIGKRFGYRPPAIEAESKGGDSEEKGYVPPSNPPPPPPAPPPPTTENGEK